MMQNSKAGRVAAQPLSSRFLFVAILLLVVLGFGLYTNNVFKAFQPSRSQDARQISQGLLETKYGLRVNLIAVTAAGGMVDVRLQVVEAEKAKALLQDKKNFPTLLVDGTSTRLNASEDTKSQEIKLEDGGNLFLLFPNAGNAVRPGASVTLLFGDTAVESLPVK
jgi:hypothetical protein